MRHVGDGPPLREQSQRVMKTDLRAPLRVRHAHVGAEQPGQRALTGTYPSPQFGHGPHLRQIVLHQRTRLGQPLITRDGQLQRLLRTAPQLVDENDLHPRDLLLG